MRSARSLRKQIAERRLLRAMSAHSPLSAILVEEAGFDAIWASGFELSALYGLPDMSLVSMTQHLDMVRAMAGRVSLPIIADIDTGFGNAVNVIHAVREYERAGAAAVVIEDKSFPKVTSLVTGGRQELVRTQEFVGKIEAAVATRRNPDFLIIARTEALIASRGEAEALERAAAYELAGADLVLVHSKQKTPAEIESFARSWQGRVPLVIVPTAYPELSESRIRALGKIGIVIYGNHAVRACVAAMRNVFGRIIEAGGALAVDKDIASVAEVFHLQNMEVAKLSEEAFLR
ncbi:phosphoenolpyruvate phosphomutase [Xaviernesmea oryzae]|uniref:Phosphoenolpyruvate phosphomutase n=1 Tax=Xaviernesmea oryzae TaxID=464029 RepID=A0A1Q9AU01_9HYPH|nr:isocitrate lyase/phosphoenolpyruvate mutase family protein [Xaviernesmea oryzae]OLP58849.1 phosphoenolpyruvate phosphomutase [Xaviernesmea oryzae]SEM11406.1 phosphoenolpyruvate phosphomutase [Xaviernesmea oryzae]